MNLKLNILITVALILSFIACSGNGENPQYTKAKTTYELFRYAGSDTGAKKIEHPDDSTTFLVRSRYFSEFKNSFSNNNNITFEFLGENNNMLSYKDEKTGKTIISSYWFNGDSLYIKQNNEGVESDLFIAVRAEDGKTYYRTMSVRRFILEELEEEKEIRGAKSKVETEKEPEEEEVKNPELFEDGRHLTLQEMLEYAGFKESIDMTNKHDTLVWCYAKSIYQ